MGIPRFIPTSVLCDTERAENGMKEQGGSEADLDKEGCEVQVASRLCRSPGPRTLLEKREAGYYILQSLDSHIKNLKQCATQKYRQIPTFASLL
jgi:hypothetical protein